MEVPKEEATTQEGVTEVEGAEVVVEEEAEDVAVLELEMANMSQRFTCATSHPLLLSRALMKMPSSREPR